MSVPPSTLPSPVRSPDVLAAAVAAWHNLHPLARRVTPDQVHGLGVIVLPLARAAPPSRKAARLLCDTAALYRTPPRRLAAWLRRHGDKSPTVPEHLPRRQFEEDPLLAAQAARAGLNDRQQAVVLTAAVDVDGKRLRLLLSLGPHPRIFGSRAWSLPRIGVGTAAAVLLAALSGAGWAPGAPVEPMARLAAASPATTSPAASAVVAVTAAPALASATSAAEPAAAAQGPPATAARSPGERPAGMKEPAAASPVAAATPKARTPAATTSAAREAPQDLPQALSSRTPAATAPRPAASPARAVPPVAVPAAVPVAVARRAEPPAPSRVGPSAGLTAVAASVTALSASHGPTVQLAAAGHPAAAETPSAPRPRIVPTLDPVLRAQALAEGRALRASRSPTMIALASGRAYAIVTRPARTRADALAQLALMRGVVAQTRTEVPTQVDLMQSGRQWRVAWWPHPSREVAARHLAEAAARGLRLELVAF